ncbi:uncharacterized protein LOC105177052 [Sesamum indicum]|uniref:Uncharacterized protein LOC105177052 n=1 Tax=Sesamum indicum TaxID=4182 RepID=A0A6I9UU04_SESIN|nr:uncharacterized protein LOC105177052 [Sesamum indicum]
MVHDQKRDQSEEPNTFRVANLQVRSFSARCLGVDTRSYFKDAAGNSTSSRSVIIKPKLQKILSGKEEVDFSREAAEQDRVEKSNGKKQCRTGNQERKGMRRSSSALEFEEVKGFIDLGFVFTEEDKSSGLVSIIPGLQKCGKMAEDREKVEENDRVSRPYLSEGWGVPNQRMGSNNHLMNWRIPSSENEIRMKKHLKVWAQTVASFVR